MNLFARSSTRCSSGPSALALFAWSAAALALPTGCGPRYVAVPDSPLLIVKAKGSVLAAMRDGENMVEVGWIDAEKLEGQTVVPFDWSAEP